MRISEAENVLPNGLHDAELLGIAIDYRSRTAALEFIADYSDSEGERDEPNRSVTLQVERLHFIAMDPPDLAHDRRLSGTAWVGGFEPLSEKCRVSKEIREAANSLPDSAFCDCTFVNDWNSFIVIAAENARVEVK